MNYKTVCFSKSLQFFHTLHIIKFKSLKNQKLEKYPQYTGFIRKTSKLSNSKLFFFLYKKNPKEFLIKDYDFVMLKIYIYMLFLWLNEY